jgi:hypothetical protein
MPSIDIQVLDGVFSVQEKAEIIRKVTNAFGEVAGQTIKGAFSMQRTEELLSAAVEDQEAWVNSRFPDIRSKADIDTFLGMIHEISDLDLPDRIENLDEYGTIETLSRLLENFSDARGKEIRAGAKLNANESRALKADIADDSDGWIGVHGWDADTIDGTVFVVTLGYSEGQGGIRFSNPKLYRSRQNVLEWIKQYEIWTED